MTEPRIVIRPKRSLLATAFISIMLATAPGFAVLYWLSGSLNGVWVPVLITHLALFFSGVGLFLRQLMVYTAVAGDTLAGNGIFSPTWSVPLADIAETIVVDTHVGLQPEKVTQYLMRDAEQRCVFRLRGNYWHRSDIEALLAELPVEPIRVAHPMKLREFFRAYPGSAYWFEDRPWIQVIAAIGVVVIIALMLLWAMTLVGRPLLG